MKHVTVVEVVARHGGGGTTAPDTHLLGHYWYGLVVDDVKLHMPIIDYEGDLKL